MWTWNEEKKLWIHSTGKVSRNPADQPPAELITPRPVVIYRWEDKYWAYLTKGLDTMVQMVAEAAKEAPISEEVKTRIAIAAKRLGDIK